MLIVTPDFKPLTILHFKKDTILVKAASDDVLKDKSTWDCKLESPAMVLLNYFLGVYGAVRPLLFGKIKSAGMPSLLKLVWFVKRCHGFFGANKSYARAVFFRFYNKK
ncbi:MAG: hypothetical protein GF364_16050 [Candidatus Lokiarchaeota archaeon]|nr:hypothetical protein [Candidatus Lokiarchaeota archaeon]